MLDFANGGDGWASGLYADGMPVVYDVRSMSVVIIWDSDDWAGWLAGKVELVLLVLVLSGLGG